MTALDACAAAQSAGDAVEGKKAAQAILEELTALKSFCATGDGKEAAEAAEASSKGVK